jgi:hypothetical protein
MKQIFLTFILLSSCASASLQEQRLGNSSNPTPTSNVRKITEESKRKTEEIIPDIPKAGWEKIFFEAIDERTDEAGITSLRKTVLTEDDIEIRVWMGFGLTKLEGFIMKRVRQNWSAKYIKADYISKKFVNRNIELNAPESGWEKTWQKLVDSEILTLPDAASINCNPQATDGFSYVVELKKGNNYRTYMYENPAMDFPNKCREAGRMLEIAKIIFEDFNLKEAKKVKP